MIARNLDDSDEGSLSPRASSANPIPEEIRRIVAELTGYPPAIVTLTADVEDDLGIDSVMLGEILSVLRERYALPSGAEMRARIPATQLRTLGGIADAIVAHAAGLSPPPPDPAPVAEPRIEPGPVDQPGAPVALLDDLRQIFAELTSYPINILSPDADLEDDLGIDSVAFGEILSVLRERYALPSRSELGPRIRPAQLRTIRGIAGIVATFGNAALERAAEERLAAPVKPTRVESVSSPMASLLGFTVVDTAPGRAVAEVRPNEYYYDSKGVMHGGLAATMLGWAMARAIESTLSAGTGCTTVDLKVSLVRPVTADVGRLRAVAEIVFAGGSFATAQARLVDDRDELYAHATATCLMSS
jgi:uncharacterized protein (TIGR00369 family)